MEEKGKSSSSESKQARRHIWNYMLRYVDSSCLKCAVELGVPDAIHNHGGPMKLSELVQALPIPTSRAPYLRRIMRILVNSGFFLAIKRNNEEEVYDLTATSKLLTKGSINSLAPLLLYVSGLEVEVSRQAMTAWIKSSDDDHEKETPFHVAHGGKGLFEFASERPEFNALFNEAMVSGSRLLMGEVVKGWGDVLFGGLRSLVDVGGGAGGAAAEIAGAFPGVKCLVLDLEHVVDAHPAENGLVEFVKGDMFVHVPPADAVLLKWILHMWNNEDCVKILQKCKEAIPHKGKVIIIETVIEHDMDSHETTGGQYLLDVHMMTISTGKERNENEWKTIFFQAGFTSYKIICGLFVGCVIEVYP